MIDLKAGFIKAIIYIPPDFSQRVMRDENPRIAFIEDNTDTLAMGGIAERIQQIQSDLNGPTMAPLIPGEAGGGSTARNFSPQRLPSQISIQTVEVYPHRVHKYLLGGSISIAIFCGGHDRRRHCSSLMTRRAGCTKAISSRR